MNRLGFPMMEGLPKAFVKNPCRPTPGLGRRSAAEWMKADRDNRLMVSSDVAVVASSARERIDLLGFMAYAGAER